MPAMKIFVPITDDMLETGNFPAELIAYQAGVPLLSQLRPAPVAIQSISSVNTSPASTPNFEARPALNSSTYMAGKALG